MSRRDAMEEFDRRESIQFQISKLETAIIETNGFSPVISYSKSQSCWIVRFNNIYDYYTEDGKLSTKNGKQNMNGQKLVHFKSAILSEAIMLALEYLHKYRTTIPEQCVKYKIE